MGSCCSKTDTTITSKPAPPEPQPEKKKNSNNTAAAVVASPKDVFVVKQRKSHEVEIHPDQETRKSVDRKKNPNSNPNVESSKSPVTGDGGVLTGGAATVRTSSCTKEEVDAILIQCGRLSRSSSGVKPETPTRGRRYSGSKRSFDFDTEIKNDGEEGDGVSREPRVSSRSASRRSSRERDPQQQRSGSKERGSGERRRVSRSPNRRSESPNPNSVAAGGGGSNRPGKMVSVPATDKGNNAGGAEVVAGVKKVQVKRNAGEGAVAVGSRTAASPRARSPANVKVLNENQNPQPLTLSRSNSKKAEHSPYRRNPLGEIDTNVVGSEQPGSKKPNGNQTVSKTRSSRLSRELDINPETLTNPTPTPNPPSYASLLLEDIQNFHQKNPPTALVADLKTATSVNARQFKKDDVVESEKVASDDLMEKSLLKYVTVRRGGGDADSEEQESSGSNSFAGSQQLSWMSSSWEPNSGDSSDCWTSKSRSDVRDVEVEKNEYPRNGIGRGRVGVHGRSAYTLPNNATVGST